jgi:hypothetical protein
MNGIEELVENTKKRKSKYSQRNVNSSSFPNDNSICPTWD